MTNLNFLVLQGCLTKDAQLKKTSGGKSYALFTLVVNEDRKHGEQWEEYANFFNLSLWVTRAEKLAPYLKKGVRVEVTGRLEQTRWDDNGDRKSRIDIRIEKLYFLSKAKTAASDSPDSEEVPPQDMTDAVPDDGADESFTSEIISDDEDGLF